MSFSAQKVQSVWEKGTVVQNYDSSKYRKDICGAWLIRDRYGDNTNIYGWEIDHIKPKAQGGTDDISNLRPLQWENNREKAAGRTNCVVTSKENKNVKL
jgi:hypothetical protein